MERAQKRLLNDLRVVLDDTTMGTCDKDLEKATKERSEELEHPPCECVAHKDEELYGKLTCTLIEISPPLDDDSGTRLATTLIPFLLKAAGMDNMGLKPTLTEIEPSVDYLLHLPSGDTKMFRGWPDFRVLRTFSAEEERRQGRDVGHEEGAGAIEQADSKMAAPAEAGVCSIGQFIKSSGQRRIVTVILHRDLSAHIAMATLDHHKAISEEVSYTLVDNLHGYYLNQPDGLSRFASVLIAALKTTLLP